MNHGTHTHWLRRTTTIAILAAAIAAPAAHAHPAYTGDVVSRYLASHPAGSSDVIDRYLISHTPTNVQAPNPVSDVLNTLQVNRNSSRLVAQAPLTSNPAASVSRSFSWRDAGIGASAALALILLLTAAGLQLTHRRRNRLAY